MNKWLRIMALMLICCLAVSPACGEGAELSISVSSASFTAEEPLTITYVLPHDGLMSLWVYDEMGETCAELIPETMASAGSGTFVWDGTDASGQQAPGDYILSLVLDDNSADIAVTLAEAAG